MSFAGFREDGCPIVLVIVQVRLTAKDRTEANKQMRMLQNGMSTARNEATDAHTEAKTARKETEKISAQLTELKTLTQSKPDEPPDKVLAAAAAKILDLDAKVKSQAKTVGQIQKQIAGRNIDETTAQAIIADLKRVGPHTVTVDALLNDEANRYANRLIEILREGGWNLPGAQPRVISLTGAIPGVIFQCADPIPKSAFALAAILKTHHVDYQKGTWKIPMQELEPAEFRIFVGSDPNAARP